VSCKDAQTQTARWKTLEEDWEESEESTEDEEWEEEEW